MRCSDRVVTNKPFGIVRPVALLIPSSTTDTPLLYLARIYSRLLQRRSRYLSTDEKEEEYVLISPIPLHCPHRPQQLQAMMYSLGLVVVLLNFLVSEAVRDSISTWSCHKHGDEVSVSFTVATPSGDEWAAIIQTEVTDPSGDNYVADTWLSTCESKSRFCQLDMGNIIFSVSSLHVNALESVLEPGRYNAYLLRGENATLLAKSSTFKVASPGSSCYLGCQSVIATNQNLYSVGDDIEVSFDNCHPAEDDWIGIFPEDASPVDDLDDPVLWMGTCGSQDCHGKVVTDIWRFGSYLAPGTYKAVLAHRNYDGAYSAKAVSKFFQIDPLKRASGCTDVIQMRSTCYEEGDALQYEFNACQSKKDDWVGLFKSSSDLSTNAKPEVFVGSCGESQCRGVIDATTNQQPTSEGNSWPLSPGHYRSVLVHQNKGSSDILVAAEFLFTVKPQGESCSQSQRRNLRAEV
jgi:hypothetical protein